MRAVLPGSAALPLLTSQPGKLLLVLQNPTQMSSPWGSFPWSPGQGPHSLSGLPQFCASLWTSPLSWVCVCQAPSLPWLGLQSSGRINEQTIVKMSKCYISNSGHRIKAPRSLAVSPDRQAFAQAGSAAKNAFPPAALPPRELTCRFLWSRMREIWIFFLPIVPGWVMRPWPWGEGKEDRVGG